jgi:nucleoid-associated protein YgaU
MAIRCSLLLLLALAGCSLPQRIEAPARAAPLPGLDAPHAPAAAPRAARVVSPAPVADDSYARDANDLALAQLELQKAQTYTGLSDDQLARVRLGELAIARNQGRTALDVLQPLNRELAQKTNRYVVAAGDSLWIIAGRENVYDNSWLWPLIWQSNLDTLRDPNKLLSGQKLKIRPNPTIDEVVKAVDYAHSYASRSVHIGEIKEASP